MLVVTVTKYELFVAWLVCFVLRGGVPYWSMQAVDLYVLERAFISTHANSEPLVNEVMRAYKVFSY